MAKQMVLGALMALVLAGTALAGPSGADPAPTLVCSIAPIQPSETRFQNVEPVKINDAGDVLCRAFPDLESDLLHVEPFIWANGKITPVGIVPYGLSDNDAVVGLKFEGDGPSSHDVPIFSADSALWQSGRLTDIPEASFAKDVNDRGQVVGSVVRLPLPPHAYLWTGGRLQILPRLPGCDMSTADAINNAGEIAGECGRIVSYPHMRVTLIYPCIWRNGHCLRIPGVIARQVEHVPPLLKDILRPGSTAQRRYAINEKGDVLIHWDVISHLGVDGETYLYSSGRLTQIPGLADAYDVNDADQVVGDSVGNGYRHAAMWWQGRLFDLNTLLPAGSRWSLESARTINNRGVLAGTAEYDGHLCAFLMSNVRAAPRGAPSIETAPTPSWPSANPREAKSAD